jgi:hypothetical protein
VTIGRHRIVTADKPEDRVQPVIVIAPFRTLDGYLARTGDTLRMTPDEIAVRVAAHQVRPLKGNATVRVRRFVRGVARHRRRSRRPTP